MFNDNWNSISSKAKDKGKPHIRLGDSAYGTRIINSNILSLEENIFGCSGENVVVFRTAFGLVHGKHNIFGWSHYYSNRVCPGDLEKIAHQETRELSAGLESSTIIGGEKQKDSLI